MAIAVDIPGYEIIRPLGSGGMSTVYLALQRSLDRKVAIKVMRRSGDPDDTRQLEKRFLLEGRMMAKLPHRNIVAVYDIVSNEAVAYIAMEYLGGGALTEHMRAGLSLADAVSVVVQIAGALDYAHANNVVHRDLKPANIMFRDAGTPVLTDFGIARQQDGGATRLTQTGMLVGTPTYMSPEQINAEPFDGRSDLYSLGVLFYEMLTGAPPFKAETPIAVLMAHLTQPPPPLPPELAFFQDILDRMLAKSRDDRFADMKEFSQTLKSRLLQSETMQMRLQVDPSLTTSEQLRALGFSSLPSSPGESLRASLPLTPRESRKPAPPSTPAAAPLQWQPASRRMWLTLAAAAVLAVVLGAWLFSLQHGKLSRDEQELVGLWLKQATSSIAENKLVTPPDENAYAYVQKTLQKDPQNAQAQALLDQIAAALAADAEREFAAGKLDAALDAANQGLLVRADGVALLALKAKIEQALKARALQGEIDALLARAARAQSEHRVFGADGEYELLGQAHALAPQSAAVGQRLAALVDEQLAEPRKALQQGQFAAAQGALARLAPYLAGEKGYAELEAQLEAAQRKQQAEKQIADLIERGNRQLREGRLDEPAGDNAYATFGELGKSGGDDKRVAAFATALARAFYDDARRLEAGGDAGRALDRATSALQVDAQLADAAQLKARIEQRLGQRAAQIAQMLGAARQAISEQRFTPPAPNDAHSALAALLKLEPDNKDARQLEAELPRRIAEAVSARAASDSTAAAALLKSAQQVYPQDAALAQLAGKLEAQIASERQTARLQEARALVARTLAARTRSLDDWRKAAQAIELLAADAGGKDTAGLRREVIEAMAAQMRAAATIAEFDAFATLLADHDKTFGADPAWAALKQGEADARARIAAAEQARIAEQAGELVLNAYPWGMVDSVLDANRKPVPLPANATTPLVLSLPAGNYVVTFRHPQVDKPAQVIAKVEAKKRASANATFPTISTQEYFTRAGWQ